MLPPEFVASRAELLSMPLIDLAERLYGLFRLDRLCDQNAYVCAFFDHLSGYLKRRVAGITDFLEEWDESLCSKSIHSTEVNGIRLLTVHKSKGLEFDNVIVFDVVDGRIPNFYNLNDASAMEEDARKLYVALSRVRQRLFVYYSGWSMSISYPRPQTVSRFMKSVQGFFKTKE